MLSCVLPDWTDIQCRRSATVSCYGILIVQGKSRFCACEATEDLVHVCSYHSLHLPLSMSLSYISPISARPAVLYLLQNSLYSNSYLSLSCFFHVFHFFTASLCLMERRRGRNRHKNSFKCAFAVCVYSFQPYGWGFSALINRHRSAYKSGNECMSCKLVFRDQGWLILYYKEEGELEELKGWVNLVHTF